MKIKMNFNRKTVTVMIAISFFEAFVYGFITPIDIFINNQNEFHVSFFETISCMISSAVLFLAVLLLVSFLMLIINNRLFLVFQTLLVSFSSASYLQELFMNGKMVNGENGTTIGTVSDLEKGINIFIFICITFIPASIILYLTKKEKTDNKGRYQNIVYKTVTAVAVIISVMKLSGFVSSYISNDSVKRGNDFNDEMYLASYEPTVSFSKENNIYVFIVDRFDTFWCDELINLYPELNNELNGFVFYQNHVSHYINTFPSITSFLTYTFYDNSDKVSFWNKAWGEKNAFSVLKENGYNVNLILDSSSTYGKASNIMNVADNFKKLDSEYISIDNNKLRSILYGLMFSRLMPYDLKEIFNYAVADLSNGRYIKINLNDLASEIISCDSDGRLYDYVNRADFNADSEQKNITVIHLNGAHDGNSKLISETGIVLNGDGIIPTIRANFETILRYVKEAERLGVYDNSTFIILGDHGSSPGEKQNGHMTMIRPNVNALLIKPAGGEHGDLKIDEGSELSNDMLSASILEYAGIDHEEFGYSYQDAVKSGERIPRVFSADIWGGSIPKNPGNDETYIIRGNARDFSNWEKANANND